jgi:transcriptional regulator with XRE-family HTH domain
VSARTRLGLLLQERREAVGYSRVRLGELVDVPAGTLEGWEIGRVAKPPVHDVLRVARVLRIPVTEIEAAVLDPAAEPTPAAARAGGLEGVPLLEQAIEVFGWTDAQAAAALQTSLDALRAWRTGRRKMELPAVMTVAALLALRGAGGARGDGGRNDPTLVETAAVLGSRALVGPSGRPGTGS